MTRLLCISLISFLAFSCSDDCDHDDQNQEDTSFLPMALGNYWLYQTSTEKPDGTFEETELLDSIVITSEVLIDGTAYFRFEDYSRSNSRPDNPEVYFRRDSSGYVINERGNILFSPNNNDGILNTIVVEGPQEAILTLDYSMDDEPQTIEVPAGTFDTRTYKADVTPGPFLGDDYDCDKFPYYSYSDGVGLIKKEVHYATTCTAIITELVDYKLN